MRKKTHHNQHITFNERMFLTMKSIWLFWSLIDSMHVMCVNYYAKATQNETKHQNPK